MYWSGHLRHSWLQYLKVAQTGISSWQCSARLLKQRLRQRQDSARMTFNEKLKMTCCKKVTADTLIRLGLFACLFVILNRSLLAWVFKSYSVYLGYIFVGFCFYMLVTSMLVNCKTIKLNSVDRFVLAYLIFLVLRALIAQELFRSVIGLTLYAGTIPVYWVMRFTKVQSEKLAKFLFWCFVYLVAFASLEIVLGVPLGPVHWYYSRLSFFPHRLSSTLGSSNHFSIILPAISIFLTACLLNKPGRRRMRMTILILVTLFFVLGTSSRAGILVYLASILLLFFFQGVYIKKKGFLRNFVLIMLMFIVFFVALSSLAVRRELGSYIRSTFDVTDWGNSVRLQKYRLILNVVRTNVVGSLVGIGMGYTGNIVHQAGLPTFFQLQGYESFYTTESSVLKLLLETGIVGLLLFYYMLFRTIRLCHLYAAKSADSYEIGICLGISCMLTLFILRSLILQVFDVPAVLLLTWGGMGWLSNMISRKRVLIGCEKRQAVQNEAPT